RRRDGPVPLDVRHRRPADGLGAVLRERADEHRRHSHAVADAEADAMSAAETGSDPSPPLATSAPTPEARGLTPSAPVLSTRGLSKSFGALAVARSIDLDLERGARLGLIGPNGAGKTTFVNLLTGVLAPDAGSIALAGQPIERLAADARVRR